MNTHTVTKKLVHFKKWRNQSFAIFNSLGREVKIGVLLPVYFGLVFPQFVAAQSIEASSTSPDEEEVSLEEVVVSGQRAAETYSNQARVVGVVTRTEIQQAAVQSIQDLLEYVLNVDVRQRGQNGMQADLSIRGGTFDQTLVLLNGVNINDPQTGHHNLNLPVALESIDRVEILSGPASRVYGPNAFTGAINLITGEQTQEKAVATFVAGAHRYLNTNLYASVETGRLRHFLSLGRQKSEGYIENTDFENLSFFYQGKMTAEKSKLDIQFGRTAQAFGANSFYTPKYPNQFEDINTTFASAKATLGQKVKFTPTIYCRYKTDRFELFRDSPPDWYQQHNYHATQVYGTNLNTSFAWKLGKTALGADFRKEQIKSNVLGVPMESEKVHGEAKAFYTHQAERDNLSLFAEHTFYLNHFTATAGVMANWNNEFESDFALYPGVDMSYRFLENLKAFVSLNKSLRLPTFTDLYYESPTNKGNSQLKAEEAFTYETGFKYYTPKWDAHASYYKRRGENMIDWTKNSPTDEQWQVSNITELDTWGVAFSVATRPAQYSNKLEFLQSLKASYSYTDVSRADEDVISAYVFDNIKHKFDFSLGLKLFKTLHLTNQLSWQDRAGGFSYYDKETAVYIGEREYQPFWLVNSRLSWTTQQAYEFFVEASNLLDEDYYDIGNVPQPGRWLKGGVKINFLW